MSELLNWPYDEVSLDISSDGASVSVKTPWLTATVGVNDNNSERLHLLTRKWNEKAWKPEDLGLVNWFFRELRQYPFCYILPTPKEGDELDAHTLSNKPLSIDSVEGLMITSGIEAALVEEVVTKFKRTDWAWDWEASAGFAKAGEKIHPESLFSIARRFHLLDVLATNEGTEVFDFVGRLQGEDFRTAAGLMVRQNHYVTQKCRESLLPAVAIAGQARSRVEQFLKEENGHDRILQIAMQSFASDPETVPVALQTKCLMHLLQFAAGRNLLAFAMAVDFFERSSYEKTDPLAKLLTKGGFDKAANQINRHMQINDAGEHENVACGFLQYMAPCDADYALEALRIAEVISLVMNSVPEAALEVYKKQTKH